MEPEKKDIDRIKIWHNMNINVIIYEKKYIIYQSKGKF